MKNKIEDLRNHLFATLEALQDKDNPMPLDRAKAISEVAQTIINTAKVEVEFLEVAGGKGSGFIPLDASVTSPPAPALPRLVK
jgi:hypothetical protein